MNSTLEAVRPDQSAVKHTRDSEEWIVAEEEMETSVKGGIFPLWSLLPSSLKAASGAETRGQDIEASVRG